MKWHSTWSDYSSSSSWAITVAKHHATRAQVGIPRHLSTEVEEPQMGSKGILCSPPFIHSPETYLCGGWLRRPATGIADNALGEPILTAVRKHLSWHFSRAPLRIYVHEPHDRDCRSCSQVHNFCATRYKDAQWSATIATTGELSDRRMELFTSNKIRSIRVIDVQIVSLNGWETQIWLLNCCAIHLKYSEPDCQI